MPKIAKYAAIAVAGLIGLLLIAVGIVAATFDPNDYKPLIIRTVQEKKQRTLAIPGEIKLRFFPKIGADLGKVSISERNSSTEFASIDSAKVSLALMPLLAKRLVVDHVDIDGMRANILRRADGSANFDDLLSGNQAGGGETGGGESGGGQLAFDIDSVNISNAHLLYDDRRQDRRVEIDKLDLRSGRIASGVPSKLQLTANVKSSNPDANVALALKAGFTFDIEQKRTALKGLDAELRGSLLGFTDAVIKAAGDADLRPEAKRFALDGIKLSAAGKREAQRIDFKLDLPQLAVTDQKVSGGKLNGEAKLGEGARAVAATFAAPSFEGSPQDFRLPALTVDAAVKQAGLDAKAKISGAFSGNIDKLLFNSPQLTLALSGTQDGKALNGSLATPLAADLQAGTIELPRIAAAFTLPNPGGGMLTLKADGNADANLGKQTVAAALKGRLDESAFDARLGLVKFSPAAYTFDIGIDRLDLDRYRGKPAAPSGAPATGAPAKGAPEQPIDLSALRDLRANGKVRIGALKAANIRMSNLRFDLRAADGRLDINPLAAGLYGGSVAGMLSAAAGEPARFAAKQTLSGVDVGALLRDAVGKDRIEGKGTVQLDVTASGATPSQIRRGLNGSARAALRDGSVRGINIAQAIRAAKAKIGALRADAPSQNGTGSTAEKTDFSELNASFHIVNGVAHNDDLDIKSPLIRVGGAGDIDLGSERLDYLARATVVATLQGQGGPELQALKGVTVPIRLSGPFDAPGWRIDFAGMAGELARQKLEEKKSEVRSKAEQQLREGLKGLFGK